MNSFEPRQTNKQKKLMLKHVREQSASTKKNAKCEMKTEKTQSAYAE